MSPDEWRPMNTRQDCAVIMARGASRRMGSPKGLLLCPGRADLTFLQAIVENYRALDMPVVVVTTFDLVAAYERICSAGVGVQVAGFAPGGETARTLRHGWDMAPPGTTHLWAHPIDMPLVKLSTLAGIRAHSAQWPLALIQPVSGGQPGHPVVVPLSETGGLWQDDLWITVPMRTVIAAAIERGDWEPARLVPVRDPGVVMDFDCPADLEGFSDEPQ